MLLAAKGISGAGNLNRSSETTRLIHGICLDRWQLTEVNLAEGVPQALLTAEQEHLFERDAASWTPDSLLDGRYVLPQVKLAVAEGTFRGREEGQGVEAVCTGPRSACGNPSAERAEAA